MHASVFIRGQEMKALFRATLLLLLVFLVGCGGMQKKADRVKTILDPRIGQATKEELVERFGLPDKQVTLSSTKEILEWNPGKLSGVTSTGWNYTVSEVLRVTFTDGVMTGYTYSPYEVLQ